MKTVIILGSSNSSGHTKLLTDSIIRKANHPIDVINLNDYQINYFDYEHKNKNDDFLKIINKIVHDYDTFLFATPVYWYAMSGIMKVFFDRLTDIITIKKDLGKKLRGKNMAVATSSTGDHLNELFWLPFSKTAYYLGMDFLGGVHTLQNKKDDEDIEKILKLLNIPNLIESELLK
ncbi:flavodoxin family protein [Aquimarina agarilytica]|uniref:flavodoxin family protein n=1 Tax=Aquimarina agarilytica TaxID=1087449 RepID=UPI000287A465|nr:flavodoxin family protein [Aquimarina agarilytica]